MAVIMAGAGNATQHDSAMWMTALADMRVEIDRCVLATMVADVKGMNQARRCALWDWAWSWR